jgi:hypothetical protein
MSDKRVQALSRPARNPADARVYLDYVERHVIGVADLVSGAFRAPILEGELVLNVRGVVLTPFDGGATLDIGDKADADGYLDATTPDLNPTGAAGTMNQSIRVAANAYGEGKYYPADDQLIVSIGGAPTVGSLLIEVVKSGYGTRSGARYLVDTSR